MTQKSPLEEIQSFVNQYIKRWVEVFLVEVSISKLNKIVVWLDADNGLNIDKCADVNLALYKFVQQQDLFDGNNFSMEVSSPGIDKPLKLIRQYIKNIGRSAEVVLNNGSVFSGRLLAADESELVLEISTGGKGKKKETSSHHIPFGDIRQTKILITF